MKAATLRDTLLDNLQYISIHAAREGGDWERLKKGVLSLGISIHAAREGGDLYPQATKPNSKISIHAAREGGDNVRSKIPIIDQLFQSTPPVKAATLTFAELYLSEQTFQSTPPVKAATAANSP